MYLARGNHENKNMNKIYGFEGEVHSKLNETFVELFSDVICCLPLAHLNLLVGSDSIMVAITWILSLMLNNPQVLKKAQDELENKIGRNRQVEESDIKDLVYLQAIVKESLRLSSPSGVIFPRAAMKDCTLSTGYHIPTGTKLMINIWKIMHDENLWPDPYSFQPERFLCSSHKDIDVRGQHYKLLPFGSGRHSCPGISLSLNVMHLILAALLHSFEITTPSNEPVDVTKSNGLTNMKATPLEVLLVPRLNCIL
ncbi:hypothetical protein Ahy_B05g075777 [Arachis hypogaea]|uniref:Cytochrome P450 n=1 Tax=Arachis hypogaea TaxID=3818 RepID=A0A444Z1Y2_ARAHY|nr:hypothetical protein Ahy_B05g075777 [Arachis hypogaea]